MHALDKATLRRGRKESVSKFPSAEQDVTGWLVKGYISEEGWNC